MDVSSVSPHHFVGEWIIESPHMEIAGGIKPELLGWQKNKIILHEDGKCEMENPLLGMFAYLPPEICDDIRVSKYTKITGTWRLETSNTTMYAFGVFLTLHFPDLKNDKSNETPIRGFKVIDTNSASILNRYKLFWHFHDGEYTSDIGIFFKRVKHTEAGMGGRLRP
jgi:hypothetical protein